MPRKLPAVAPCFNFYAPFCSTPIHADLVLALCVYVSEGRSLGKKLTFFERKSTGLLCRTEFWTRIESILDTRIYVCNVQVVLMEK